MIISVNRRVEYVRTIIALPAWTNEFDCVIRKNGNSWTIAVTCLKTNQCSWTAKQNQTSYTDTLVTLAAWDFSPSLCARVIAKWRNAGSSHVKSSLTSVRSPGYNCDSDIPGADCTVWGEPCGLTFRIVAGQWHGCHRTILYRVPKRQTDRQSDWPSQRFCRSREAVEITHYELKTIMRKNHIGEVYREEEEA